MVVDLHRQARGSVRGNRRTAGDGLTFMSNDSFGRKRRNASDGDRPNFSARSGYEGTSAA